MRYCYVTADGTQSPTLRLLPGDLLILRLKNELIAPATQSATVHQHAANSTPPTPDPCQRGEMTALATNLHFHGLVIPPVCHQDEVLKTTIHPSDAPFEYRLRIPTGSAARPLLVSPPRSRFHQSASARRRFRRADRRRHRTSQLRSSPASPNESSLFATRTCSIQTRGPCKTDSDAPAARHARRRGRHPQHRHRRRQARERSLHQFRPVPYPNYLPRHH